MKVVFVYPYYEERIRSKKRVEFPPLGMLYIAAIFQEQGFDVEVVQLHKTYNIDDFPESDIYAYAVTAVVTYPMFLEVVPKLKDKAKIHICGNTQANTNPLNILRELQLDAVFAGESEESIRKWIQEGCKGKGVIYGGQIDVNNIPLPARKLLRDDYIYLNSRVGGKTNNVISIISSRGCLYQCKFCGIQNRKQVRYRNKENFDYEVRWLLENYPEMQGLTLLDETFTFVEEHALGIAETIRKYNLPWECNSRADRISEKVVKALVESNCQEIRIGMETGSQFLLNKMVKGTRVEKSKKVIKMISNNGLPVKLYMMHGYPGENKQTTNETIELLTELKDYVHRVALYRFVPLPGSPIYNELKLKNQNWENYTIYENDHHWWGIEEDYQIVRQTYRKLEQAVNELFPQQSKEDVTSC